MPRVPAILVLKDGTVFRGVSIGAEGLAVGDATVDLRLDHHPHNVSVDVLRREGDVEILSVS